MFVKRCCILYDRKENFIDYEWPSFLQNTGGLQMFLTLRLTCEENLYTEDAYCIFDQQASKLVSFIQ